MIKNSQIRQFHNDGYLVLKDFKDQSELDDLRRAALNIVDAFDAESHKSIFTTQNQTAVLDEYFKGSGDKVRCFFEAGAFDADGQLAHAKALSINKIGHAMHDLNPEFEAFSRDRRLAEIFERLGNEDPKIWQSMYIFKQPRIGGTVDWHQDATFFYTEPLSVITLWFAIDDATLDNGCLWVSKSGDGFPLKERFELINDSLTMTSLDDTPWPTTEAAIPLEVAAGTLILFKGRLPHYSAPNSSNKARHAYTMHVTDGRTDYAPSNWIQRGADFPARGFQI
ncbi:MAG: phytanoyl-CoA dioxygenase family protein [Hellea sp.]|nr:phytanoyl-CoA dioxygenase family protein [Hellea sp.]